MTEVEHRLDDLSKAVANGHSRRRVLKMGLGMVGAALGAAVSSRAAAADPGGNSDCAHFCQTLPPGPLRGECVSAAAHGDPAGFCARCAGDVLRICGNVEEQTCCNPAAGELCCPTQAECLTCPPGEVPNLVDCRCDCPVGQERCGGTCRPVCPPPQTRNPSNCQCECPTGTTICGSLCCPAGQECREGTCQPTICVGGEPCVDNDDCACGDCINGQCSVESCEGAVCGTFTDCHPEADCQCYSSVEGVGICGCNRFCAGIPLCSSSDDCGPNEFCAHQTCCGPQGVCLRRCDGTCQLGIAALGITIVGGQTAGGRPL